MTGINPFDWYGPEFLMLYGALFISAVIASFVIAANLRPEGLRGRLTTPDEIAVLLQGKDRFAEVIAARLLQRGALKVEKSRLVRLPARLGGSADGGAVENAVLRIADSFRWSALRKVTDAAFDPIEQRLIQRGLLMARGDWFQLGFYAVLPLLVLMLFGLGKVWVGLSRERPVAFLVVFLFITGCVVLARWSGTDRRTKAGLAARMEALEQHARLEQAHTADETGLAVALFGTGILATSSLGDFHKMRAAGGSDGGGSSGSDGGAAAGAAAGAAGVDLTQGGLMYIQNVYTGVSRWVRKARSKPIRKAGASVSCGSPVPCLG